MAPLYDPPLDPPVTINSEPNWHITDWAPQIPVSHVGDRYAQQTEHDKLERQIPTSLALVEMKHVFDRVIDAQRQPAPYKLVD